MQYLNRSLNPFQELRRQMDRLFDDYGTGRHRPFQLTREKYPALNVWDEGERFLVEAEVPGVRNEDLEIHTLGNELILKGTRPALDRENRAFHRQERGAGTFTRVITLPAEVDPDQTGAELMNGVLTLRLAKAKTALPKKISVKAG